MQWDEKMNGIRCGSAFRAPELPGDDIAKTRSAPDLGAYWMA